MPIEMRDIDFTKHLDLTLAKLDSPGLLLVARGLGGRGQNAMAIGWATFGIIWGLPICVVLVRPSRYTYLLIEECQDFTVNVPAPGMEEAVAFCGSNSGREHDKFAATGLVAIPSAKVSSPVVEGALLQYECQVVHFNDVVPPQLAARVRASSYPSGDFHRLYYGEIVAARIRADIV